MFEGKEIVLAFKGTSNSLRKITLLELDRQAAISCLSGSSLLSVVRRLEPMKTPVQAGVSASGAGIGLTGEQLRIADLLIASLGQCVFIAPW